MTAQKTCPDGTVVQASATCPVAPPPKPPDNPCVDASGKDDLTPATCVEAFRCQARGGLVTLVHVGEARAPKQFFTQYELSLGSKRSAEDGP